MIFIQVLIWVVLYFLFLRHLKLKCPHCQRRGISAAKKLFLGPLFSSACSICGGRWRTSHWSIVVWLLSVPAIGILFALSIANSELARSSGLGNFLEAFNCVMIVNICILLFIIPTIKK